MTKVREFNCNNKNFLAEHDLQGARDERSRLNTNEGTKEARMEGEWWKEGREGEARFSKPTISFPRESR